VRVYVGFDDTDVLDGPYGTGKLVRRFEGRLPGGCALWGVVRQQLLIDDRIPYTSHNSSACAVIDCADPSLMSAIIARAVEHIERESSAGSDPGLCAVREDDPVLPRLIEIGRSCTAQMVTQQQVLQSVNGTHLSGHGGTHDGIIGAAAAVAAGMARAGRASAPVPAGVTVAVPTVVAGAMVRGFWLGRLFCTALA